MTFNDILQEYEWETPTKSSMEDVGIYAPHTETSICFHIRAPEIQQAGKENRLWTVVNCDDTNCRYLVPGYHHVNRDTHLISTTPIKTEHIETEFQIDEE